MSIVSENNNHKTDLDLCYCGVAIFYFFKDHISWTEGKLTISTLNKTVGLNNGFCFFLETGIQFNLLMILLKKNLIKYFDKIRVYKNCDFYFKKSRNPIF